MNTRELVSIVVPAYNVENEIVRCIDSILGQTYSDIEIIVIDDGSTDRTGEVINEKYSTNGRIKIIHQDNKGLSGARNTGIDQATGKYLFFVDSDDFIDAKTVEVMMESLEETKSDIAVCGRTDEYPGDSKVNFCMDNEMILTPNEAMKRILLWDYLDVSSCDKLYRKDLWDGIRFPEGHNNEDLRTIPKIIAQSKSIVHVAYPFYHYCHREGSITTKYDNKKINDFSCAIKELSEDIYDLFENIDDELIYFCNRTYLNLIMMSQIINYDGDEYDEAKEYLKKNWNNLFSKKHMSRTDKILYLLTKFKFYKSLRKIRSLFRS